MSSPILHGKQVTLRLLTEADLPRLLEILLQPEVAEWWPGYDMKRLQADAFEDADVTSFAVEFEGEFVGVIMATEEPDPYYTSASIDIALDRSCLGRGLGSDAIRALAEYLFDVRQVHRLTIDPAVTNEHAIAVYRKVGFQPVGVMRCYERGPGGAWHDNLLLDMLEGELS